MRPINVQTSDGEIIDLADDVDLAQVYEDIMVETEGEWTSFVNEE